MPSMSPISASRKGGAHAMGVPVIMCCVLLSLTGAVTAVQAEGAGLWDVLTGAKPWASLDVRSDIEHIGTHLATITASMRRGTDKLAVMLGRVEGVTSGLEQSMSGHALSTKVFLEYMTRRFEDLKYGTVEELHLVAMELCMTILWLYILYWSIRCCMRGAVSVSPMHVMVVIAAVATWPCVVSMWNTTHHWEVGEWGTCTGSCPTGTQLRSVSCVATVNGEESVAPELQCRRNEVKPVAMRQCDYHKYMWKQENLGGCEVVYSPRRFEKRAPVYCTDCTTRVADELCGHLEKPQSVFPCGISRRVRLRLDQFINDHEIFKDETCEVDDIGSVVLDAVEGSSPTLQVLEVEHCCGLEVRSEFVLSAHLHPVTGTVRVTGTARLYEGNSCSTNDLEDRRNIDFTVDATADTQKRGKVGDRKDYSSYKIHASVSLV
eukprot:GFYU01000635.1.p1 GENE.GFYU01000635.1~~GFYU01000635.1.p1  ORF type:complete len:434 (-),score=55.71 GFYU01000635.1:187-1488(-)